MIDKLIKSFNFTMCSNNIIIRSLWSVPIFAVPCSQSQRLALLLSTELFQNLSDCRNSLLWLELPWPACRRGTPYQSGPGCRMSARRRWCRTRPLSPRPSWQRSHSDQWLVTRQWLTGGGSSRRFSSSQSRVLGPPVRTARTSYPWGWPSWWWRTFSSWSYQY